MQVVHIHIPRTAGSALQAHLWNLPGGYISEHSMWGDYPPSPDRVFLVILREPVERIVSLYDYIRTTNHPKRLQYAGQPLSETLGLPDIEETIFCNGMCRQLSGPEAKNQPIKTCEAAWSMLRRPDVIVGTTDDINDALARLATYCGADIPPLTFRKNVTTDKQRVTPELAQKILAKNAADAELWRRVSAKAPVNVFDRLFGRPFFNAVTKRFPVLANHAPKRS